MKPFKSEALGEAHEYRALFSDRVKIAVAAALAEAAHGLTCRAKPSDPWAEAVHNQLQIRQVVADMDAAEDEDGDNAPPKKAKATAPEEDDEAEEEDRPHRVTRRGHR